MNFSKIKLPTNRKFGIFFTLVFFLTSIYFFYSTDILFSFIMFFIGVIFALITIINEKLLTPLNKLWAKLGLLLGIIISPLVLGVLYFFMFTPIAIITRIIGRDELNLKMRKKNHTGNLKK